MQNNPPINIKTLKFRIKDKHAKALNSLARDVNFVWNFCNDLSLAICFSYIALCFAQNSFDPCFEQALLLQDIVLLQR